MKINKALCLISLISAVSLAGCSTTDKASSSEAPTEPEKVSPESISFEWQAPYEAKLEEFRNSEQFNSNPDGGSAFEITDVTGDDTPELIISPSGDKASMCSIYTCEGGNIVSLGETGFFGEFEYLPEQGYIHEEYSGEGFIIGKYKKYEDGELVDKLNYSDNSGEASSGATITHSINGDDVLLSQYEETLTEYGAGPSFRIGRKYTFGDAAVNYGIRRAESWGAVLTTEQKELARGKLNELLTSLDVAASGAAFELCDLNGDDVPELVVSEGAFSESQCRIYYFNGGEMSQLDGTYGSLGCIKFDMEKLVFYAETPMETTYWSLADSNFSAADYVSSGSVMQVGRKYSLTEADITAALL